ncbi:MAG: hypothetical protein JSR98_09920, partial [Proteobacteria bacterium]|nr:hypothetical protein [Pseudomonadota bacterium]
MRPDRRNNDDLRLAPPQDGEAFRIVEDAPRRRFGPRAILFAGVAGACVLGVGLGLWARPGMAERRVAVVAPEPPPTPDPAVAQTMKIVVNDGPAAQVGAPIETLRPAPKPLFATLRPRQDGQAVMGQVPELTRLQPKPLPALQMPHIETPHLEAP